MCIIRIFFPLFLATFYFIKVMFLRAYYLLWRFALIILCLTLWFFIDFKAFFYITVCIRWRLLHFKTIQRCIGLYKSCIYCLGMPGHHAFIDAHFKNLIKKFFEQLFAKKITRAAYRTMPRQRFIYIVVEKVKHIHTHAAELYKSAVIQNIFQVAYKQHFEKHYCIYAL